MKTILFALALLLSAGASAQNEIGRIANQNEIGRIPNQNGGSIVLTNRTCKGNAEALISYAHSPNTTTIFGCWIIVNQEVMIEWGEGEVRVYQIDSIRFSEDFKRYMAAQKQRM